MEADRGGCPDPQWVPAPPHHWDPPAPPQVELSRGNNVLYWRTTAFSVWSKVPKPVLVRNIGITGRWARGGGAPAVPHPTLSTFLLPGVAYTSECFPCKPGTYAAAAGSSFCQLCPANTFSSKGATACQPCEPATYAGESRVSLSPLPPQPRDAPRDVPAGTWRTSRGAPWRPHRCHRLAEQGSASCKVRPPCTDKDYFYTHTACDANGEVQPHRPPCPAP